MSARPTGRSFISGTPTLTNSGCATAAGYGSGTHRGALVTTATIYEGATWQLAGTFKAGSTYQGRLWAARSTGSIVAAAAFLAQDGCDTLIWPHFGGE